MPRGKYISEEEYQRLYNLHTNGLSLSDLSDKEDIPYNTLYYGFKDRGWNIIKHYDGRLYDINKEYFSDINSSDKAYFLGLIIADGFVLPQKGNGVLSVKLKKSDSYILEEFRDLINSGKPLYEEDTSNNTIFGRNINSENSVKLDVASEEILKDLKSYGIVRNKTGDEILPDINSKYYNHLIRGIFDGDGSIGFRSSRPNQRQVYICSSSQEFCNSIRDLLLDNSIDTKVYEEVRDEWNNIYRVTFNTHKSRVGFYKYIYQDSDYFLDRKYEKYQKYVNTVVNESSNELSLP